MIVLIQSSVFRILYIVYFILVHRYPISSIRYVIKWVNECLYIHKKFLMVAITYCIPDTICCIPDLLYCTQGTIYSISDTILFSFEYSPISSLVPPISSYPSTNPVLLFLRPLS
jgi:hypothetical protein